MAFAAVNCLIETLEDLLRLSFLAVDINSLQIKITTDQQLSDDSIRDSVQDFAKYMLIFDRDTARNGLASPACLSHNSSIYSLRKSRFLLYVGVKGISDLYRNLCFLLTVLKDLASICDDHEKTKYVEVTLINMAYRIEDIIEESIFDSSINSQAFNFINGVLNGDQRSVIGEVPFMTEVFKMYDKEHRMQQHLQQALTEIDLIKREVKKIYDGAPIVTEYLQLGKKDAITDSLQHMPTKKNEMFDIDDGFLSVLDRVIRVPSGLEIIAIVGMGGIGKTTLARRVFEYRLTCHHFYIRAWVKVPQVYQVRDILIRLLRCIKQKTIRIFRKSNGQLAEDLYRSLKGKRFLIVMDNIWSTKAWDDVKRCFPDDKNGSRIVLTTRLMKVADYVNPKQPPHYVNLLGIHQSWKLLQQKVFGEEPCPLELEDVGRRIARKCQGLPLAIVVIAGILCKIMRCKIMRTRHCWEGIAESVSSVVCSDPEQRLETLALSYNHLPNHLKACFLYMGAFPEDCEIDVKKLISLWIAEGFLDKKVSLSSEDVNLCLLFRGDWTPYGLLKDGGPSPEEIFGKFWQFLFAAMIKSISRLELEAEAYLEDLIDRNLVLVGKRSFSGKIKTCRLHNLVQDLCLREAEKEKFMHVIRRDSEAFPAGMINWRRLSLHSNFWDSLNSVDPMPLVRSFLCFSLGFGYIPDTIFSQLGFKLLRVLDIIFLPFPYFPVEILKLVQLRYLALTATYELPISLSELRNLRTLIIQGPWIHRKYGEYGESPILPFEYWNMPWLRHLQTSIACYLSNPFIAKKDLRSPWKPTYLRHLSTIRFSSCSKEVFSLMPLLKELVISESEEDYRTDVSCKWLSNLVHLNFLEALKCSFYVQNENLRNSLHWVLPSSLKKLTLSWSYVPWEDMNPVVMLPNLEVLKLKNHAFHGPEWEPSEKGFRRLKHLLIEKNDLVHWKATRIHFPRLEHLALRYCKSLEEIPFGIAEIPTLQLIELHYCSDSAENSAKEIQEQIDGLGVDIRSSTWDLNLR